MKTYAAAVLALLFLSGCSRREAAPSAVSTPAANPAASEQASYPLTGEILSVDVTGKILRVRHDKIEGYMPAMTMEFAVSAGDAAVAKPGQRIRAEMIPTK